MRQKLCRAAARGSVKRIKELLRAGEDVNWVDGEPDPDKVDGWLSLYREAGSEYVPKTGIGKTPLLFAAANGYTEAAVLLLENGADLDAESAFRDTPLNRARKHEKRKERYNPVVDLLLEAGATNYGGSKLEHQPPRPARPSE